VKDASRVSLRGEAGLIVESGEPREVMHFCLLCGYGANAVNPYLAFELLDELQQEGELPSDMEPNCRSFPHANAASSVIIRSAASIEIRCSGLG